MNEAEWMACENPTAMIQHLVGNTVPYREHPLATPRKLRLLACAFARCVPIDPHAHKLVDAAELVADGLMAEPLRHRHSDAATMQMMRASLRSGAPFLVAITLEDDVAVLGRFALNVAATQASWAGLSHAAQAALARCILGNPFREPALPPSCLTPEVLDLAQTADIRRDPLTSRYDAARLAVLSDALEEAGCGDEHLLRHLRGWHPCNGCGGTGTVKVRHEDAHGDSDVALCKACNPDGHARITGVRGPDCGWQRSPGPHFRGCWAVDELLGRA